MTKTTIMVDYRTGDVYIPKLSTQEALLGVANDFIQSIINKRKPKANALFGQTGGKDPGSVAGIY